MAIVVVELPSLFEYTDLFTLSGLDEDESLIITNNTSGPIFVNQAELKPSNGSNSYPVKSGETILVHNTFETVWARGGTGPVVVQELTSTITPFTGVELPQYIYTNDTEAMRRIKVSSEPSIVASIFNGLAYSISGSFSVANNDYLALNFSPAAESIIHKAVTNSGLNIEVRNAVATGTADGIFTATNLNLLSDDSSPAEGQLYSPATPQGSVISAGISSIEPYTICDLDHKPSIVVRNTTGVTTTIRITITFEEIGQRASSFGLTPSTILLSTTEMSDFG
jgi:hypothetical protein